MTILLAELYLDGGRTVRRYSDRFWYSRATDSIGVQEFVGRITSWPTFSVRVGCLLWSDQTGVSFGALDIANADGGESELLEHTSRDCLCVIRAVEYGQGYDDSVVLGRCIIDTIDMQADTMRVSILGMDSRLDRPLQPVVYPDTADNAQIIGKPLPVTIGQCLQIEPVLVDPISLEYQCSDNGPVDVGAVFAGGSPYLPEQLTPSQRGDGVVVSVPPAARLTAHADGPSTRYDDLLGGDGLFNVDSTWDGPDPDNWTQAGDGTVTRIINAGANFEWDASPVTLTYDNANVLPDTNAGWYMITGRISYRNGDGAHLGLRFRDLGTLAQIFEEGEFCRFVYVAAGADRSFRIGCGGTGAGEIVVESIRLYQVSDISLDDPFVGLIWHIANRGGLTDDNFDQGLLTRSDQSWIRDIAASYHQSDNTTARQALQFVLQAITGWAFIAPDGYLRVGTVDEPTGDPDLVASELNITSWPIYEPDTAPGLSDTYGAEKNWSPYSEQELAGITHTDQPPFLADYRVRSSGTGVLARMYRHAIGAPAVGTGLVLGSASQSEANRITSMHESEWGFWMFSVAFHTPTEAASLMPGAKIAFDHERFGPDFTGGQLIAVDGEYGDNTLALIVRAKRNPA